MNPSSVGDRYVLALFRRENNTNPTSRIMPREQARKNSLTNRNLTRLRARINPIKTMRARTIILMALPPIRINAIAGEKFRRTGAIV
jgi:hypothetical protein